jgi:uncharacterized protein (DUF952 family)
MNSGFVYHITTPTQWAEALAAGEYRADTLATEGFMHCSTLDQVEGVLARYYAQAPQLVRLKIDREKVIPPLVFELAGSIDEVFPHIHGPLNLDAVVAVETIR